MLPPATIPVPTARPAARLALRAFTLVEVVLALSVLGIVLAALGSVLGLTLRALPGRGDTTEQPVIASRALEQISDDIVSAKQIAATSTTLALVISDRDATGGDERIEYQWSGTKGAPLQRRFNGGAWNNVIDRINGISFAVSSFASSIDNASTPVESSEQILSAWETGASATYSLSTSVWAAQIIMPVLPGDTISWRPTKVEISCRNVLPVDGSVVVDVRSLASDGTPSATSLGTATLNEASLTASFTWYTIALPAITGQSASTGLAMLFRTNGSGVVAGRLQGATSAIAGPGSLCTSANGGMVWTTAHDGAIYHRLWGAVTRSITSTSAINRVRDVTISLTPSDNTPIVTRVLTPALPEAQ